MPLERERNIAVGDNGGVPHYPIPSSSSSSNKDCSQGSGGTSAGPMSGLKMIISKVKGSQKRKADNSVIMDSFNLSSSTPVKSNPRKKAQKEELVYSHGGDERVEEEEKAVESCSRPPRHRVRLREGRDNHMQAAEWEICQNHYRRRPLSLRLRHCCLQ